MRRLAAFLFCLLLPVLALAQGGTPTPGISIGNTPINGGTSGTILYNNSGKVGNSTALPSGTTVVATGSSAAISLADRFARQYYVTDFGAVCDGVTDDRVAVQTAITASAFGTLHFPKTQCAVSAATADYTLTASEPVILKCEQGGGIKPLSSVASTVSTLYFVGSPYTYARTGVDGCFIGDNGAGTRNGLHGIVFDTQAVGGFTQPFVRNSYIQLSDHVSPGYAILAVNDPVANVNGGVISADFSGNVLHGGIFLSKSGDSITVSNNIVQGPNESVVADLVNGGGGMAGNLVISGLNSGSAKGAVVVRCAASVQIVNSELEQSVTNTNPNNAVVDLVGTPGTCQNGPVLVSGNQIQSNASVGDPLLVFVGGTSGAVVDNNRLATASGWTHVSIGAAAVGTVIGAGNTFIGGGTDVADAGTATRTVISSPSDHFIFKSATVTTGGTGSLQPLFDFYDRSNINTVPNVSSGVAQRYFALGGNYVDQLATVMNHGLCDNRVGQLKGDTDWIVYTDASAVLGGVALSGCHNTPYVSFLPLTDNQVSLGVAGQGWSNIHTEEAQIAGGVVALTRTNGVGTTSKVSSFTTTAVPAGGSATVGMFISSAGNGYFIGSGPPTLSAPQGSFYMRSDGAPAINTNGSTGWDTVALLTSSQTFTNKTLTSPTIDTPTISAPTITGTATMAAATLSGALKTTSTLSVGSTSTAEAIDLTGNMFLRTGGAIVYGSGAVTLQSGSGQGLSLLTNAGSAALTLSSSMVATFGGIIGINLNSGSPPAVATGTSFRSAQADGTANLVVADAYGAANSQFVTQRAAGTAASPTAVQSTNILGIFGARGFVDVAFGSASGYSGTNAGVVFRATENWTATNQGASGSLRATPIGSITPADTAVWDGVGFKVQAGKELWLGNAYVNTPATPTGYLLITDSAGAVYKIPACLASGC